MPAMQALTKQKIAITATFTSEPVEDSLSYWLKAMGFPDSIEFAQYNQIFQELLNPSSLLATNQNGVNVVLVRFEDWQGTKNRLQLTVDDSLKTQLFGQRLRYRLPNHIEIAHLNQYETEYLYQEIFVDRVYLRHGIVLNEDDCIIDVGANIGLFTLFAQQKSPKGTIYAFEPAPHAFDKLQINAKLYCPNTHLFNCGLGGERREETFTFYPRSSVFSSFAADAEQDEKAIRSVIINMLQRDHSLDEESLEKLADEFIKDRLKEETYQVQLRTLSEIIEEYKIKKIDLLKLDAEKSELAILQGINNHHWSLIKQIVMEVHDQEGSTLKQVLRLLEDKGFRFVVDEESMLHGSGLFNIYATRLNLNHNPLSQEWGQNLAQIEQTVKDFTNALKTAITRSPNPYLVCICPPSPTDEKAFNGLHEKLQEQLETELQQNPSICLIKSQELLRTYPVQEYYDPYGDELGHIPYNLTFFTALGTILARKILALKSSPYKVIALDCDNTLWNGICGEDGVKGVKIDAPFRALQEFIIAQQATGKLICLCSKNQADDVFAVFEQHPDMLLQRNHLVNWRINWQEKSQNLQSLAEELQLGLDSFIFIDDNPIECAKVRANCPEVLTLQLPQESEKIPQFLDHIWAFDQLQTTQEDQQRTNLYQQNIQRQRLQENSLSFEDFLAQLNLEIEISPVQKEELTRVAQLTQRTNQFNLTTIRRSESQIKQLCNSGELDCRGVKVKDRFGDYGLVGLLLFTAQEDSLMVDTFLLSCRVLGRGVEHQILAYLGTIAQEKRLAKVELFYKPTPKNKPIWDFLTDIEKGLLQEKKDGVLFEFPAQIASETTFSPRSNLDSLDQKTKINLEKTTAKSDSLSYRILNYQFFENIAQNLYNPELILQEIAGQQQRQRQLDGEFVAPRTPLEKAIASLFIEVLKLDRVGIDDDFFVLGGDSLQATQLISRIRTSLKVELPLPSIFTATTVTTLAQEIEQWGQKNLELTALTILPRTGDAQIPLSYAQQRLWFLDQFQPNSALYNIPLALRLEGNLNQVALEQALQTIIERHEALRTNFLTIEGKPTQIIQTETNWTISIVHPLQPPRKSEREITCQQLINTQAIQPFDLATEPLIRVTLLTLSQTEQVLLVCMHHVVSDGWSMGVFVQELAVLYDAYTQGKLSPLAPLPIQYADFALWQRQWLQEDVLETQLAYWQKQLAGATTFLPLPTDKPRPAVQTFVGAHQEFILSPELSQKLTKLSQEQGVTLFMTLFAAFDVLLYRYTGQTDILVGTPIANRNHSEIEGLIGFFVNTLVLRTNLAENSSFEQLLAQVREVALEAYSHQDLPFEMLVEALQPERDISYTPLFQVMFVLQNTPLSTVELTGLSISSVQVETNTAKFDLSLAMENTDAGLVGVWEYNTDLFSPDTIERMTGHFLTLLEGIVTNQKETLAELPLLTQLEQKQLLIEWNNTQVDYPDDKCIHQLFEEQVERTPNAVAVVFEGQQLTYNELNCRTNQLAHYLQSLGVKADELVGICVERSLEMIVGLLGILKAGGAYVPLDPEYPLERLSFMLEDAAVNVLVTQQKLINKLPEHQAQLICLDADWELIFQFSRDNLITDIQATNLAYVIYTSGSTGQPKGVMLSHSNLSNHMFWMQETFPLTRTDRVLQKTPFSFDASVWEFYAPLLVGGQLLIAQPGGHTDSDYLLKTIAQQQVTTVQLVPSLLQMLLEQGGIENCQLLKRVFCGGEILPVALQEKLFSQLNVNLCNLYGPTECCIDVTFWNCQREMYGQRIPIGRPIFNTQIYILDSNLQPVPVGIPGELHIGGAGLARGYLNRPELTQEKFIPNPFSNYPDSRLYKTGDLARYLPDGNIEYLGRIDNQVKIRGFRIELGEIETVLTQNPQVQSSVIIACEDTPGNKRLVAYIVPQKDATPTPNELRQFLKEKLPEYMIPSAFVILESLPLTPNGKIDRRALPEPEQSYERTDKFILPRNPIEEILVTIWSEVLKVKQVSINDNFFELGGHSLLATQLISRIRTNLQIEIPLRSLFAAPTIEELGQQIQQLQQQDLTLSAPPILPRGEQSELLLSYAQTRLWFLDQLETNSAFYNIPVALRLQGHLNQAALIQSLEEIIQRHEALRTNFVNVNGQPTQVIQTVTNWTVSVINLQHLSPEEQEIAATNLVKGESFKPFDLANEALVRATLIVLNNNEYWLLLCLHHVISDGWSMGVFIEELTALYNAYNQGQPSPLKPLPIQYADFAVWQRQWLQGEVLENQLNYWQKQLADAPTFLPLPTDKPRPAVQTFTGAHQEFQLSLELTQKLTELSQQQGVTMFMTLLAVYGTLLYRYTGQSDILIGTPIANRNRREIESLIGFFVNTLVMRTDCSENPSFQELLMRVREMSLGAYAHQDLPFEMLVEALQPERNLSHTPLFQVMFVLQNTPLSEVEMSGLTVNSLPLEGETAKFDLTLSMQNTETGLMGVWEYNTDLFNSETIERMNGHFMTLLEGIIANPRERVSQLPLLTKVEQQQLLIDWNNTEVDYPDDKCIHQLFEEQVERTPNAVAVVFEGQQLTYNELNCRTNQLAHYLQSLGVKADELVGICVERSLEMIVGLLGILKAGGAYVPLDPEYPLERLSFMLEDAAVNVLVTQVKLVESLPQHQAQLICLDTEWEKIASYIPLNPESGAKPDNLTYIIYTSGSTGKPKGVLVNHSNVVRLFAATDSWYHFNPQDVWTLFHSYAFDFSVWEIWGALLHGGRLVIVPYLVTRSPEPFLELLCQEKVTILNQTPTAFRQLIQAEASLKRDISPLLRGVGKDSATDNDLSLRLVIFGGESLEINSLQPWFDRHGDQLPQLVNMYGITETTVHVTYRPLSMADANSTASVIGRPLPDLQVYLLNEYLQPVPVGVPGEMYVGGAGVTRGYLNRPELTTERFIPILFENSNPQSPTPKLYKTGDLARYLPNGELEYLGRIDNQVKIRGFRIELGEIEALLASHPQIWETVVLVWDGTTGDKRLVAYIVPQSEITITIDEIRQFLKAKLPSYMIPNAFVILDALPLTANGKIDRRALPPSESSSEPSEKYVAPRNPIEDILVNVWSEILKVEKVGINDNFFELGGHSLLATQLVAQIRDRLEIELPLRQLFNSATLAELAQEIEQLKQKKSAPIVPAILPRKRK